MNALSLGGGRDSTDRYSPRLRGGLMPFMVHRCVHQHATAHGGLLPYRVCPQCGQTFQSFWADLLQCGQVRTAVGLRALTRLLPEMAYTTSPISRRGTIHIRNMMNSFHDDSRISVICKEFVKDRQRAG